MTKREQRCLDFVTKLRTGGTFKVCWSKAGRPRIENTAGQRLTPPVPVGSSVTTIIVELLWQLFPENSLARRMVKDSRYKPLHYLCSCVLRHGYMLTFLSDETGTAIWHVYPLTTLTGVLETNGLQRPATFQFRNGNWYTRIDRKSVVVQQLHGVVFIVAPSTPKQRKH